MPRQSVFLAFFLCTGIVFCVVFALKRHSSHALTPTKIWSIDLATDKDFQKRLSINEVLLDPPSISFIDDSHLICSFYSGAMIGTSDTDTMSRYHVLEIDALNGDTGRRLAFSAFERNYKTMATADGGFVVLAGDTLTKFSDQFVAGPTYATPRTQNGKYFDRWLMDVAPGGKTLILYDHHPGDTQGDWTWLESKDLSVVNSMRETLSNSNSIQAADRSGIGFTNSNQVLFSAYGTKTICSGCDAHFLTNDLLYLRKGHSYSIQTIAGKTLNSGDLDAGAGGFTRALSTSRFAYMTGHYIGSGFPIQTHFNFLTGTIHVLDWQTNHEIAVIQVNEPAGNPSAGLSQMALALSPDGTYLAVLLHHTLTYYRLPS